jgi:predicted homoserine dehydrogenase-like protein
MIYTALFDRATTSGRPVRAGVIGVGQYATAIVTQAQAMRRLEVPVLADLNVEAARLAYRRAGLPDEAIAHCETRAQVLAAMERGRRAVVADAMVLMDLPLDVIVESTGSPEAAARHGAAALRAGKHLAMVSKEPDATIGPYLKRLADAAGLVYSAVDGDQHGLLIGLVDWCRELGLDVLCGGKARDTEFIYDDAAGTVRRGKETLTLTPAQRALLAPITPGQVGEVVAARRQAFAPLGRIGGFDVTEMAIAANATGLLPDVEALHCPAVRITEMPEVLCPAEDGGLLGRRGVIDSVTCLRRADEAGLGGGVFVVVSCANDYSRRILTTKGLIPNAKDTAALIYRPYHLCGVETPITLLTAGLLGLPTGGREVLPRVDLVARAGVSLPAGSIVGGDHDPGLEYLLLPARAVRDGAPLPLHMATGHRLRADVPAGTIIRREMVEAPADSALWALRQEMDSAFALP